MEIERKFLVNDLNGINLEEYEYKKMAQDYLYIDKFSVVRIKRLDGLIRKIETAKGKKFKYTIKTAKVGISVNEIEREISEEDYAELRKQLNSKYNTIEKTRYIIPYMDNLKIELDVFHGIYEGVIFAEIEFSSEEQAYNTELPKWFGKEVSSKITNSDMAFSNSKDVLKLIEDIKTGN